MPTPIHTPDEILAEFGGRSKFDGRLKFAEFVRLLLAENERINLVSRETTEDDLYKLIADCLFPFSQSCKISISMKSSGATRARALDVGSGGGLPGVPLGLVFGGTEFTMIERTQKKARFLGEAMEKLGISGSALGLDFSEADREGKILENSFDLACMRWVKLERSILGLFAKALKPGGVFLYYSPLPEDISIDAEIWKVESEKYLLSGDEQEFRTITILTRK